MLSQPCNYSVTFDVGGRHFRVSKSLIEQCGDTLLARLVSKTWQTDPSAPIFIDRDGDRFAFALDYLRYGQVTLPDSIPKDGFLRDMDFYGIVPDEHCVKRDSESLAAKIVCLNKQIKNHEKQIKRHTKSKTALLKQKDYLMLANACFQQYVSNSKHEGKVSVEITRNYKGDNNSDEKVEVTTGEEYEKKTESTEGRLFTAAESLKGADEEFFNASLAAYGLRLAGKSNTSYGVIRLRVGPLYQVAPTKKNKTLAF